MEPRAIAAIVEKIARSPLSVSAYFKRHKLPFGRSRYFQYKAQLAANGLDGLVDGRSGGNRRELTAHAQGFIRGVHQENPQLSLRQIADRVESSCGIRVSRMTVSRCLLAAGLKVQWPRPVEAEMVAGSCFDRPRPLNLQPRRQQTPAHGHTTHPYAARTLHAVGDLSQTQLRVFLMYSTDETLRMCCQLPAISSAATVHQTIQTVSRELRLILEIPRPAERHFVSFEIGGHRQG